MGELPSFCELMSESDEIGTARCAGSQPKKMAYEMKHLTIYEECQYNLYR